MNTENYQELPAKRETFQTLYSQHEQHNGKAFEIIGEYGGGDIDKEETGALYNIKLSTGEEIQAWPEEIFSSY